MGIIGPGIISIYDEVAEFPGTVANGAVDELDVGIGEFVEVAVGVETAGVVEAARVVDATEVVETARVVEVTRVVEAAGVEEADERAGAESMLVNMACRRLIVPIEQAVGVSVIVSLVQWMLKSQPVNVDVHCEVTVQF